MSSAKIPSESWEEPLQKAFLETHLSLFAGRDDELDSLKNCTLSAEGNFLILSGPSGSGKTALLARLCETLTDQPEGTLLYHFVEAGGNHRDVIFLLKKLVASLGQEPSSEEPFGTQDYQTLSEVLNQRLLKFPGKLILVLDGLERLYKIHNARELFWLPTILPGQIKVILSLSNTNRLKNLQKRFQAQVLDLGPLSESDQLQLLKNHFPEELRDSAEGLFEKAKEKKGAGSPLYLSLLARRWKEGKLSSEPKGWPETTEELVEQILTDWEENWEKKLIQEGLENPESKKSFSEKKWDTTLARKIFAGLVLSRNGAYQEELKLIVKYPSMTPLKEDLWEALYGDLKGYLWEWEGRIEFFHPHLSEEIHRKYLGEKEAFQKAHESMAFYFMGQGYENRRTLSELAYHLNLAEKWDVLFWLLARIDFIESKIRAGMISELLGDYQRALEEESRVPRSLEIDIYPGVKGNWKTLKYIEEALQRDFSFVETDRDRAFQSLWNRIYWRDTPECESHYQPSSSSLPPWKNQEFSLSDLAKTWQIKKQEKGSSVWLQSLRPLDPPLEPNLFRSLSGHQWYVTALSFHPREKSLATGSWDGTLRLWDLETEECLRVLEGHEGYVNCISFTHDGEYLLSGSEDKTLRLWKDGEEVHCFKGHGDSVFSLALHPQKNFFASGSRDHTIKLWDLESRKCVNTLKGHQGIPVTLAFSPDGKRLVSGSSDYLAKIWDLDTGDCLGALKGHKGWVQSVAFSPDGKWVITGSEDRTLRIWDGQLEECKAVLKGHRGDITSILFSPDEKRLITASRDGTIRVWNWETREGLKILKEHRGAISQIAFSPDKTLLASASWDQTLQIWEGENFLAPQKLKGHNGPITSLDLSDDGAWIVTASTDQTLCLWKGKTGSLERRWEGHCVPIQSVAISGDGEHLISQGLDGTLKIWDRNRDEPLEEIFDPTKTPSLLVQERWGEKEEMGGFQVESQDGRVSVLSGGEPLASFPLSLNPVAMTPTGVVLGGGEEGELVMLKLRL